MNSIGSPSTGKNVGLYKVILNKDTLLKCDVFLVSVLELYWVLGVLPTMIYGIHRICQLGKAGTIFLKRQVHVILNTHFCKNICDILSNSKCNQLVFYYLSISLSLALFGSSHFHYIWLLPIFIIFVREGVYVNFLIHIPYDFSHVLTRN